MADLKITHSSRQQGTIRSLRCQVGNELIEIFMLLPGKYTLKAQKNATIQLLKGSTPYINGFYCVEGKSPVKAGQKINIKQRESRPAILQITWH